MTLEHLEGFNPLSVFRHPNKTIQAALENPSLRLGIGLVLLPWILAVIISTALSFTVDIVTLILAIIMDFILFIISVELIYFFAKKTSEEKNLFAGIFTALSLARLVSIIFIILGVIVFLAFPSLISIAKDFDAGAITASQFQTLATNALAGSFLAGVLAIAFFIIALALTIFALYLTFAVVCNALKSTAAKHVAVTVIVFIVSWVFTLLV